MLVDVTAFYDDETRNDQMSMLGCGLADHHLKSGLDIADQSASWTLKKHMKSVLSISR